MVYKSLSLFSHAYLLLVVRRLLTIFDTCSVSSFDNVCEFVPLRILSTEALINKDEFLSIKLGLDKFYIVPSTWLLRAVSF